MLFLQRRSDVFARIDAASVTLILTPYVERSLSLAILRDDVVTHLDSDVTANWRQVIEVIKVVETWWDKCRGPVCEIESERESMHARLTDFLEQLRYAP